MATTHFRVKPKNGKWRLIIMGDGQQKPINHGLYHDAEAALLDGVEMAREHRAAGLDADVCIIRRKNHADRVY